MFLLQLSRFLVDLNLPAELAVLFKLKFAFTFCVHVNFVPVGNVILVFTDGTN